MAGEATADNTQMNWWQQVGNDPAVPGYKIRRADGTWVQKGMDGQYHPYVEFAVKRDENGNPITDENGNWIPEEGGGISNTPSDYGSTSLGSTMTTANLTTPQQPAQEDEPDKQKDGGRLYPWWAMPYNPWGREPHAQYKEDRANLRDKQAAQSDMIAQRMWQTANRDPRNEANKDAQAEANQKFTESQQQLNGSDNTSLVGRQLVEKDPQQYRVFAEQQAQNAASQERNATAERDQAIQLRQKGAIDQYNYRQNGLYNLASAKLTMGPPKEKDEKKQEQQEQPKSGENPPQQTDWGSRASVQDVLNCLTQQHWDEIQKGRAKAKANGVPDMNPLSDDEHVTDWWEVSHRDGHTVAQNPDLDTPEYKAAVEKIANDLWNGTQVTINNKQFGGNGLTGFDAYQTLHEGERGGTSHGWQNFTSEEGHKKATDATASQTQNIVSGISKNTQSPMYAPAGQETIDFNNQWYDNYYRRTH